MMRTAYCFINSSIFFLFLIIGGSLVSCGSAEKVVDEGSEAVKEGATNREAKRQFYHAWLADCVNDMNKLDFSKKWAREVLEDSAKQRITRAINNKYVVYEMGEEALVWGPKISVEYSGDGDYISANLIYCLKKSSGSHSQYSIGIAGTNMVSPFDWFKEDFEVESKVESPIGGRISFGTHTGLVTLTDLKDETGKSLVDYLKQNMVSSSHNVVSVAGHSLGGALTQAYSAYLKTQLNLPKDRLQAWVYAGPTAGNETFATALTSAVDYHAYNNTLDVISHAWRQDKLNELCSIYDNIISCSQTTKDNPAVNGVVKYLRNISKYGEYSVPGTPVYFTGDTMKVENCVETRAALITLYFTDGFSLYKYLNDIARSCDDQQKISRDDFVAFFFFMMQLGNQHTTAYFDHFFGKQANQFTVAMHSSVPGGLGNFNQFINMDSGKNILEKFLKNARDNLKNNFTSNCKCES